MAALNAGLLLGCHKREKPDDFTQPPYLVNNYQFPVMLATVGQPFASVTPPVQAYYYDNGVGSYETLGFSYSVSPALPAGLGLNTTTGVISGTPTQVTASATYQVSVSNVRHDGGGVLTFPETLGVQASSTVTLDYAGTGALSTVVGASPSLALPAGAVSGGVATGFGVTPALPAGLVLNSSNGLVSGSPTAALVPAQLFTLTAFTPQGSGWATFALVVAPSATTPPLGLAYSASPFITAAGVAIPAGAIVPSFATSGADVVFTVSPLTPLPLSSGLTLNPLTGELSGTPTLAASGAYTILATNSGGTSQADFVLTVTGLGPG